MKSCPRCHSTYPSHFSLCPRDGTTLIEAGEWSEGMVIRGKYRILSKLGQGGMGAVYKAHHVMFEELRALKVMNADLVRDEVFVRRFKQEAVIARKLDHPNAVRVDDIDEGEDGRPFIVMEYIRGASLKRVIQEEGRLAPPRVWTITAQVAGALDAAHRVGMVHRDIKPANIVLVRTAQGEQAKVLDFGIAKLKEARVAAGAGVTLTGTGMVVGTPQYMSPEQAMGKRGDQLDGRSDLYSLGVVMYQMLTGQLPFKSDTTMGLLMAHINSPPRPMLEARPELHVPPGLVQLVMKCLEKKREMRPPSGAALIQQLQSLQETDWPNAPTRTISAAPRIPAPEIQQATASPRASESQPAPIMPPPAPAAISIELHGLSQDSSGEPEVVPAPAESRRRRLWIALLAAVIILIGTGFAVWRFDMHSAAHVRYLSHQSPASAAGAPRNGTSAMPASSIAAAPNTSQLKSGPATGSSAALPAGGNAVQQSATKQPTPFEARHAVPGTGTPQGPARDLQASRQSQTPASLSQNEAGQVSGGQETTDSFVPDVVVLTSPPAPGATVFMDGTRVGVTDGHGRLTISSPKSGIHHLRFSRAGFSDVRYILKVPAEEGGIGTIFVTAKWSGSQNPQTAQVSGGANGTGPAPSTASPGQALGRAFTQSFDVVHIRRLGFGSSKGVLVINSDSLQFRADGNGKDSFTTPLDGVIWGKTTHGDFYVRLANGKLYTFRTESPTNIENAITEAMTIK